MLNSLEITPIQAIEAFQSLFTPGAEDTQVARIINFKDKKAKLIFIHNPSGQEFFHLTVQFINQADEGSVYNCLFQTNQSQSSEVLVFKSAQSLKRIVDAKKTLLEGLLNTAKASLLQPAAT